MGQTTVRPTRTAYATSFIDLNALALSALIIFPLKARREPMNALTSAASTLALANDTPPTAFAKLFAR